MRTRSSTAGAIWRAAPPRSDPSRRRSRRASAGLRWLVAAVAGLAAVPSAQAQEQPLVLRLRAERLVHEGRCGDAIPLLQRSRKLDAGNARAALLEGQCAVQLRRYSGAVAPLEEAKRLDPSLKEADLFLTIAHFHLGDYDRAQRALETAQAAYPDRAETQLYAGLLLLQREETEKAAARLERAIATDADAIEPVGSYYAGLAWASAGNRERAERAFERVSKQAPGTAWAAEADRALARLQSEPRRYWLSAMAGLEYDSNATLRGGGVQLPQGISRENDGRGVWSLAGAYEFYRKSGWASGISGSYYGTGYFDLNEFDFQSPGTMGWLEKSLDENTLLRGQADFTYNWQDGHQYLWTLGTTTSVFRNVGQAGLASGYFRYARNDYQFRPSGLGGPPGVNAVKARDRDGNEFNFGTDYQYSFDELTLGSAGFRYQRYDSEGSEYEYNAYRFGLGVMRELPWKITADLYASYEYRPYDNPSTFQDPPASGLFNASDRREHSWRVGLMIQRPITPLVTASLVYNYYKNDSNVQLYDYDRNIVGLRLSVSLPR